MKQSPGPTCGSYHQSRAAKRLGIAPHAPHVHPSADVGDQCDPSSSCRVRDRAPVGRHGVEELLTVVADVNDRRVPEIARACLSALGAQLRRMKEQILEFDRLIRAWHRSNEMSMRLEAAPGVGPVLATALVAAVADPKSFRSGATSRPGWYGAETALQWRQEQARQHKKQGDRYLRGLFVAGALSVIRYAKIHAQTSALLTSLLATADQGCGYRARQQDARMVWAMMARGERYKEPVALAR